MPETKPFDPSELTLSVPAFLHADSDTVHFWVPIDGGFMGASIARSVLHYHFRPEAGDDDPLQTFLSHQPALEAAVRRRIAQGSIEPVMLREHDLREDGGIAGKHGP